MRDDLITLLIAGHETTAAVLTWLVYALSQHPECLKVVQKEIDEVVGDRYPTIEDIKVMPEVPQPAPKCPGSQQPPLRGPRPAASSGPIRSLRASPLGPRGAHAAAGRPEARGLPPHADPRKVRGESNDPSDPSDRFCIF